MSYLDPKERVIDLQLTSYGKYLLSIGKLDPVYYAFFDDDIIYDGEYANISEKQSEIEPRIQENTPRFSVQTVFSGRDLEIFSTNPNIINDLIIGSDIEDEEKIEQGLVKVQDGPEHNEILQQPLGRSNPFYKYSPAWNVKFLKQPLSASTDYLTVSGSKGIQYRNIPQLDATIRYPIYRNSSKYVSSGKPFGATNSNEKYNSLESEYTSQVEFADGSVVAVQNENFVLLQVEESSTFFENDNFEIEFFQTLTVDGNEKLIPLQYFDGDGDAQEDYSIYDHLSCIQSYFTVHVDQDISSEIICPLIQTDTTRNVFENTMFDCEDVKARFEAIDIYDDIDDTEDVCDE